MRDQTHELTNRLAEVQQLANKVHQAKVAMDHSLWGPGGMPTDPEALRRSASYLRRARGPYSVTDAHKEAHLLTLAYRKVRAEYMLAKAEFDALSSHAAVPDQVKAAREKMKKKYGGAVQQVAAQQAAGMTEAFVLSQDSGLTRAISTTAKIKPGFRSPVLEQNILLLRGMVQALGG